VYRLVFDDGGSVVGHVWDDAEIWRCLFQAGHAQLGALGVRTPQAYFLERSRMAYPVDIAVVEDVRGGTLETQLEHDAPGTRAAMARLSDSLEAMHQHRRRSFGKISAASGVAAGHSSSCEQIVLGRALGHLADAASRVERMAAPAASWNTPRLNSQPP
jgi:hypothetical protein